METSSQNLFYLCAAQVHWNIDMLDFFINAAHPSVGYGNMPDALMCTRSVPTPKGLKEAEEPRPPL